MLIFMHINYLPFLCIFTVILVMNVAGCNLLDLLTIVSFSINCIILTSVKLLLVEHDVKLI